MQQSGSPLCPGPSPVGGVPCLMRSLLRRLRAANADASTTAAARAAIRVLLSLIQALAAADHTARLLACAVPPVAAGYQYQLR